MDRYRSSYAVAGRLEAQYSGAEDHEVLVGDSPLRCRLSLAGAAEGGSSPRQDLSSPQALAAGMTGKTDALTTEARGAVDGDHA